MYWLRNTATKSVISFWQLLDKMVAELRLTVPFVDTDTIMYPLIDATTEFIKTTMP